MNYWALDTDMQCQTQQIQYLLLLLTHCFTRNMFPSPNCHSHWLTLFKLLHFLANFSCLD